MKKKYNLIVRKKNSLIKKIALWICYLGDAFEEQAELKRNRDLFDYNNRYREYRKF